MIIKNFHNLDKNLVFKIKDHLMPRIFHQIRITLNNGQTIIKNIVLISGALDGV